MNYIFLLFLFCSMAFASPQGESFNYQGKLTVNNQPANGVFDFRVEFSDAFEAGNIVASTFMPLVNVEDGIFNLNLDIGDFAFSGNEVWIELHVAETGVLPLDVLLPRQLITNAPYAIQSKFVASNGVDSNSIKDASVNSIDIAFGAVGTIQIQDNSVTTEKIANGSLSAIDIDSSSIQRRILGTCAAGNSIRAIEHDGSVTCETDDSGNEGWGLTGNSGINANNNFIGTTDNESFIIKANNIQALKATDEDGLGHMNLILGTDTNKINKVNGSRIENVGILGGRDNIISTSSVSDTVLRSAIVGGTENKITDVNRSIILGGNNNEISLSGAYGIIAGGSYNKIIREGGFAAGFGSKVNHPGGWVWNDISDPLNEANSFGTTAENQFLIRAVGGVGIGTNAPESPMHIKGQGTSAGSTGNSNEVVMTIEPNDMTSNVAAVINKLEINKESALMFSNNSQPEFDIRTTGGTTIDFNHYDNLGTKSLLMKLIRNPGSNRMDVNVNVEPFSNNSFNLGAENYRWTTIYATNPLDVSSDKRLKENVVEIGYGLSEILSLRPVSYNWKQGNTEQLHIGLIAQEVESIIPEIVSQTNNEKAMRSMRYTELLPVLIKATQEQQILIEQQDRKIEELIEQKNIKIQELEALIHSLLEKLSDNK